MSKALNELHIGAGGWAYFQVSSMSHLEAYSKAFDFVEVNSTFYELPTVRQAEGWRRLVPPSFRFAVRAHRSLMHDRSFEFEISPQNEKKLERTLEICRALKADVLHFELPPSLSIDGEMIRKIDAFFGSIDPGRMKLALEVRTNVQEFPKDLVSVMKEHSIVHCTDLLRGELPAYGSDVLYSRLFGKGYHNIYQPDDDELSTVDRTLHNHEHVYLAFHGARMYSDAARLKVYEKTGKFPMVTKHTGLGSLESVLMEDASFPSSKENLVKDQGWKLFDLTRDRRVRLSTVLKKLPDRHYGSLDDVMAALNSIKGETIV